MVVFGVCFAHPRFAKATCETKIETKASGNKGAAGLELEKVQGAERICCRLTCGVQPGILSGRLVAISKVVCMAGADICHSPTPMIGIGGFS